MYIIESISKRKNKMNGNAQRNMALFSLVLGVLSLIMILFGFSLPFAALGLILALLSRGGGGLLPRAKAGLAVSVIGLILGLVITITSVWMIRSGALDQLYKDMRNTIENTYNGEEADELLEQFDEMFGDLPSSGNGGESR